MSSGGTGTNTLTANNVILGNGTSAVQFVAPGTSGNVLTSNGTTWASAAASGLPPGTVIFYAADTAPTGYLKANGAVISRTTYADLFAAIGTTFGAGDGSTTFGLPDLRGEFIRGWDDGRGVDSGRAFGSAQSSDNLSHTHTGNADSNGAHTHFVVSTTGVPAANSSNVTSTNYVSRGATTGGTDYTYALRATPNVANAGLTDSAGAHTHSLTINSSGAPESRPRNIALLACIKY